MPRVFYALTTLAGATGVLAFAGLATAETTLYEDKRFTLKSIGYLRAGIGYERDGDDQIAFQNPGARAKYRLGNEAEVFSELSGTIGFNRAEGEPLVEFTTRGSLLMTSTNEFQDRTVALQEAYGRYFFPGEGELGGAAAWAGTRFYRRFDIHINDFYYWSATGTGGGVEKLPIGIGQASLAVFATATDDVFETGLNDDYTRIDARYEQIPLYEGATLDVGGDARFRRDGPRDSPGFGVQLGARFLDEDFYATQLASTLQLGSGAATSMQNFANLEADNDDLALRFTNHALYNSKDGRWSAQAAGLVELQTNGPEWLSFGVRPIYSFNKYLAIAVEPGLDINFGDGEGVRVLGKGTLALLVRHGNAFFDRPELRFFVTHAQFDDTARRLGIAPTLEDDRNNATTFGVQIEHFY